MRLNLIYNIPTKYLVLLLCLVSFFWTYMIINVTRSDRLTSDQLKTDILKLSEQYVKTLALEHKSIVDGPYAARLTGYDLKKTLAVLLQNILERIGTLEVLVKNVTLVKLNSSSSSAVHIEPNSLSNSKPNSAVVDVISMSKEVGQSPSFISPNRVKRKPDDFIDFAALIRGVQEHCELPPESKARFPECDDKIEWMNKYWQSDPCYSKFGVNGNECSSVIYLSEVESFCPRLPSRIALLQNMTRDGKMPARFNKHLSSLLMLLPESTGAPGVEWIKQRIILQWPLWLRSLDDASQSEKRLLPGEPRARRKLVLHAPELLLNEIKSTDQLIQWADLLTSLHVLGHDILLITTQDELRRILDNFPAAKSQCQARRSLLVDAFYVDETGANQFVELLGQGFSKFSCLLRVIAPYGVESSFNTRQLVTVQYMTRWPDSADNTFLGAALDLPSSKLLINSTKITLNKIALLHTGGSGLPLTTWRRAQSLLRLLIKFGWALHISLPRSVMSSLLEVTPGLQIVNHNYPLTPIDQIRLYQSADLLVGLGFPINSLEPLVALAAGLPFLNIRFPRALRAPGGASTRNISWQQEYLADEFESRGGKAWFRDFVTLYHQSDDKKLELELTKALVKITKSKMPALQSNSLPFEFTVTGMLQRVAVYVEHQDLCDKERALWPPSKELVFYLGVQGQSCAQTCSRKSLRCEPMHFESINKRVELQERGVVCEQVEFSESSTLPAYEPQQRRCLFQSNTILFSCVSAQQNLMRFCPCRSFLPSQSALCNDCL